MTESIKFSIDIELPIGKDGKPILDGINCQVKVEKPTEAEDILILKASQKTYNYIAIGKHSPIRLPAGEYIKVYSGGETVITHVHRTQTNRVDGLKKALNSYSPGDAIRIAWNPEKKELVFSPKTDD